MWSGSGVRHTGIWFPVLPVIKTITLEELSKISEPQSPILQNGMIVLSPGIPEVTQEQSLPLSPPDILGTISQNAH